MKKKGIILINIELSDAWLELLVKAGFNTVGLHALYQFGGLQGHIDWLQKPETQALLSRFEAAGIAIEHQLHAVDWLLPRSLFQTHPDWFRVDQDGHRVGDWNLCVSNEDALHYLEDAAYRLAALLKQKSHEYYIWGDDCLNATCHCDRCKALSGADQSMIVTNHILRGIRRYDPAAKLSFLAYQDALTVPTVRPDAGVFLEFAPIDRNHHAALTDPDQANAKIRQKLADLLTIFPADNTQILEYFLDVSLFCKWKKEDAAALNLDADRLTSDIRWYADLGVAGITTFAGFIDDDWRQKYGDQDILLYGKVLNEHLK